MVRFDPVGARIGVVVVSSEWSGASHSRRSVGTHLLDVIGVVRAQCLEIALGVQ